MSATAESRAAGKEQAVYRLPSELVKLVQHRAVDDDCRPNVVVEAALRAYLGGPDNAPR